MPNLNVIGLKCFLPSASVDLPLIQKVCEVLSIIYQVGAKAVAGAGPEGAAAAAAMTVASKLVLEVPGFADAFDKASNTPDAVFLSLHGDDGDRDLRCWPSADHPDGYRNMSKGEEFGDVGLVLPFENEIKLYAYEYDKIGKNDLIAGWNIQPTEKKNTVLTKFSSVESEKTLYLIAYTIT
jgi:hypothetical protein